MMQYVQSTSSWVLLVGGILFAGALACTRPELIGADLLEDEAALVGFTDTIALHCSHHLEDAVLTYSGENGRQTSRSLVGHLNDPFFGKSEASFYTEIFLLTGSSAFLGTTIDSVVLSLRYDTLGVSGDLTQQALLGVYLLAEELDPDVDILSDYEPMIEPEPVALKWIYPQPYDSLYIQSRGDSLRVPPMVRMQLSPQFIDSMMQQDSSTFESADSFRTWIKGLHARMTQADNTMLGFDLNSAYSELTVYYQNEIDTFSSEVSFAFTLQGSGVQHTRFSHDYTGSEVQKFIDDAGLADSLLFVQGMSGINLAVSLPGLPNIDDILINKAELEFYVAELPGNNLNWYAPIPQLINAVENEEGNLDFSEDVNIVLGLFRVLDPFGGELMESDSSGTSPKKYLMNVTASLQDIYKGRTDNLFYIIPFLKPNVPNRVILYGPAHPTYPARLRLTYTVVQ